MNIITGILSAAKRSRRSPYLSLAIATGFLHFARNDGTRSLPFSALLFADQRYHHALNLELARGDQIWIARVFRFEIRAAMLDNITFQRRFAVDQRRNDIAVAHLFGVFQNHNVTIKNVSP